MDPVEGPPAFVFDGGVVPRIISAERRADGSVAWWFDPEPLTLPDGSRVAPPALVVRSPDGSCVVTRRDGTQVAFPPRWAASAPPPTATATATKTNRGAILAIGALAAVAAVGGGVVVGGAIADDDDVASESTTTAISAPEDTDTDTTTTAVVPSASETLDGARFEGEFITGLEAVVNEVAVDVTAEGVVLELHLHVADPAGCLYFDLEPGDPLPTDASESGLAGGGDVSIIGGSAGHACDQGGPDASGPVPASVFVFVTVQEGVDATGTLTLDDSELSFTAREV